MTSKGWLAISTLSVFCCGNMDAAVTQSAGPEAEIPPFEISPSTNPTDEVFGCVVPPSQSPNFPSLSCARPLLPSHCLETRDFDRVRPGNLSNVLVLSIHGGEVEQSTSEIGKTLANRFAWDRYDFNAHGTTDCLRGGTNRDVLHITATHFNDPLAVDSVRVHNQAVSLHGDRNLTGARSGTVCVGGNNRAARRAFIASMNPTTEASFAPFRLTLVDAATATTFPCNAAAGIARANIVNLVNSGQGGGLQLEMGADLLTALHSTGIANATLQALFQDAVKAAMTPPP